MTTLGIDLGTASVLVYIEGRGIVLTEPSVVAVERTPEGSEKLVAVGEKARLMLGKTPENIETIRPMRDGVIANCDITKRMLKYFIDRICRSGPFAPFLRPAVIICVPACATSVERDAVITAAITAGARKVALVEEPMAAAIGAGIDIDRPYGGIVVDIGGGTTDIAVLSLGRIVVSDSVRCAGNKIDEYIVKYFRDRGLIIGERAAEELKILLGCSFDGSDVKTTEIMGRDVVRNTPASRSVSSADLADAIRTPVGEIMRAISGVLQKTPPELCGDIFESGIILTGGGALLKGLDRLIADAVGVPVKIAEDPLTCVAVGAGLSNDRDITFIS